MRRFGLLLLIFASAGAATLGTAGARVQSTSTICHRTASKATPYVKVRVSGNVLRAHGKHSADIIPAPAGGCPKTVLTPTSGGRDFRVALAGDLESPAGDQFATGTAVFHVRAGQGQVCYQIAAKNLTAVAAHIHRGGVGAAGPVVVPLTTPNAAGTSSGCAPVARPLVKAILAKPDFYYVNVHTADFPAGAIRGQLTGTSPSRDVVLALDLKGTSEPNATGTALLRFREEARLVCYRLHVANVTLPTGAAHIHRGTAGVNGPVVVPFTAPGADGNSSGCVTVREELILEMLGNQAGFYVNVHTNEHPAGAIRSQLG
jgi:hypothetical protein